MKNLKNLGLKMNYPLGLDADQEQGVLGEDSIFTRELEKLEEGLAAFSGIPKPGQPFSFKESTSSNQNQA